MGQLAKQLGERALKALPFVFEWIGIGLIVAGVHMVWRPLAFVVAGGFIVWISEAKS